MVSENKREESTCDEKHIIHDKAKNSFQLHYTNGNLELTFS